VFSLLNVLIAELRAASEDAAPTIAKKKADVHDYPMVFMHVGLLVNRPPGTAGLPFI
jgi:hypothetical protein